MKKVFFLSVVPLLLFGFITQRVFAQTPTIQDCLGAIPICQPIYVENNAPLGVGNYENEINSDFTCSSLESNSIWYTFTVNQSGKFGFVITPNEQRDDYDWALFDITNATCEDIYRKQSLLISCNASGDEPGTRVVCNGQTGANGASSHNVQGPGCSFNPPTNTQGYSRYNSLISVQAGNTYVLMVNNYTGSQNGYTINFGLSDAGVLDMEGPELLSAEYPQTCNQQNITLNFNENIQCSSIGTANFSLTGPNGNAFSLTLVSEPCKNGADYAKEFQLAITEPLVENGTYTFTMSLDGSNHILDNCNNPYPGGVYSYTFEMNAPGLPTVNLGDNLLSCDGQPLILDATNDQSTYRWQDGSTNATLPVTQSGSYRVTVTNACGQTTDQVNVTWINGAPAVNLGADTVICASVPFTLQATGDQATYLWQDGLTSAAHPVSSPGTYAVTVTNACGMNSDQITIEFVNAAPQPDLGEDIVGCMSGTYPLDATSERATYLWQDGSTRPVFSATQSGLYSVTVTNACGQANESIEITLLDGPPNIDLGQDTVVCFSNGVFSIDATADQATYLWQDGSTNATLSAANSGTYAVTVTNACGPTTDQITVEYVASAPQPDLGEDIVGCSGASFRLDATSERATYLWQDGSTLPVLNAAQTGMYSVTVTNVCGQVAEGIEITLLNGPPVIDLGQDTVVCANVSLALDATANYATYRWTGGSTSPIYTANNAGVYAVTVTNACGPATDQIAIEHVSAAPQPDLGEDIIGCVGQSFPLDAAAERATYLWQNGSTNPVFNANQSGLYSVTVTNACGQVTETIEITLLSGAPVVELGRDSILCSGSNFSLDVTGPGATYLWQDGSTAAVHPVNTSGVYAVTVTNACGSTSDAVTHTLVSGPPRPNLGGNEIACTGETFLLDATSEQATYQWQDGSTGATFSVSQSGLYRVTAVNVCGQGSDEVTFTFLEGPPVVDLGPDQIKCEGESLQLNAANDQAAYTWSTGATTSSITISTSAVYRVSVTNACGQVSDEIEVNFIPKIEVDLGEEKYLCEEDLVLDARTHSFATHRWQDGSTDPLYPVTLPGLYTVEINSACETVIDSVRLNRCEICDVYTPNAFSPNGDGQNDLFQAFSSCELTDFTLRIFDRWGTLVFESRDPAFGWDGKFNDHNLPNGVYVWALQYTVSENGKVFSENVYGDVAIIR